jgi:hypothetical protein
MIQRAGDAGLKAYLPGQPGHRFPGIGIVAAKEHLNLYHLLADLPAIRHRFAHRPIFDAALIKQQRLEFGQVDFAFGQHGFTNIGFHDFTNE